MSLAIVAVYGRHEPDWKAWRAANRSIVAVAVWCTAAAAISYGLTTATIHLKGYSPLSATLLFRSGLDGDTRYFQNLVQAVVAPCPVLCCWRRTFADLVLPAFVPIAGWMALRIRVARGPGAAGLGALFLFLATPYIASVILFPQAVSIHPYMYDQLLVVPAAAVGGAAAMAVAGATMNGAVRFAALLVMGFVTMSNLVGIAQAVAALPH